jgi:glycosyltransferase involved in cell wall biosynthesis
MPKIQPLVSVCIPTFNSARTINKTVNSILCQNYSNFIIHISDNASTDDTVNIIRAFKSEKIIIHEHELNIGGEGNFNRCIDYAEGKYTVIFHADDIYSPEILIRQVSFLEEHLYVGAVFTAANIINEKSELTNTISPIGKIQGKKQIVNFETLFKLVLKYGNFIVCSSAMVRTSIYKHEIVKWRNEIFDSCSDLDVWLRISQSHSVGFISDPLMQYRIDKNQFSAGVRLRTHQSEFLRLMKIYMEYDQVQIFITKVDILNYKILIGNDYMWRAINNFTLGNVGASHTLVNNILTYKFIHVIFQARRGLLIVIIGVALKIFIVLKQKKIGTALINFLRSKLNK